MKRTRNIIILSSVLAVLIAIYAIFTAVSKNADGSETDPPNQTPTVYTIGGVDASSIQQICYELDGEQYCFNLDGGEWRWEANTALRFEASYFEEMAQALTGISSTIKYDAVDGANLADYGLTDPISITFTDKKYGTQTFNIGKLNAFNGQYYFSTAKAPHTVYMVDASILTPFKSVPDKLLSHDILPFIDDGKLVSILVEHPSDPTKTPVTFTYQKKLENAQLVEGLLVRIGDGEDAPLEAELAQTILDTVYDMSFGEFVTYDTDKLGDYGLDTPTRITISYKQTVAASGQNGQGTSVELDRSITILTGACDADGTLYAMLDGSPYIYKLTPDTFTGITNYPVQN